MAGSAITPSLVRELREIVGPRGLVEEPSRRVPYECDALALERQRAELVLLPASTDELSRCMRVLAREAVPVVPRGAGTGLAGGARPVEGGAVVGTARMRRVLAIDPVDRVARVEAGLVNVDLTRACAADGLFYAPDPSSQMACTLGGNVANNSGGPHCFKHGATTRHVLGLVVVLADGEVLDLSAPELDPAGYDLLGLFVGCEGMFGVATELSLRLSPAPAVVETVLAIFPSLDAACDAVSDIIAARLEPSALEILDKLTIEAVEASVLRAGYPANAEAVLLLESEGSDVEVAAEVREMQAICERRGAFELRRARDAAERKRLWAGRKGAFGAMGRIAPDLYVADVVVPRTRLRELVQRATEVCAEKRLKLSNVFHAGDGNLHPNISYDRRDPDELARVLAAGREIMEAVIAAGGSLTGEHGVGLEKREEMRLYFTDADLDAMRAVRRAWDPDERMNPGKLVPVRVCMETRTRALVPEEAAGR